MTPHSVGDFISLLVCLVISVPYLLLVVLLPHKTLLAIGSFLAILAVYLGWSYYVVERQQRLRSVFSPRLLAVVLVGCTGFVIYQGWVPLSVVALVHLGAIVFIFSFWVIPFTALYQDLTSRDEFDQVVEYPPLTILVPAYNEEQYVSRTIRSLLNAGYPAEKQIVVIDDGSTDGTLEEARRFESDTVTVVSKDNGGKYSALNYGLLFTETEIVVTVDADSVIETDALRKIVSPLVANPDVGAVASNVKIYNRESFVTQCQTLEYVFGINIFRRAFDQFAAVSVVPGCLGAYRRDVLEEVDAYDPHTLTEDFDTTLKVMKHGYKVRFSEAVVYTEAPDTWQDLYHQRLRWYRGNIMTLRKHLFGDVNPANHYLNRIQLPFALGSMVFTPLAGWVILGYIGYLAVSGYLVPLLILFVVYTSLLVLMKLLALRIEGESSWYLVYAPLFVVGYKHFNDIIMLQSILDVLRGKEMEWTTVSRVDQGQPTTLGEQRESATDH